MNSQEHRSAERQTLPPERLATVRDRVRDGFYDSPAVAEMVARRIIVRGDL